MPDYILLTGHRKSGTTLLRALFDANRNASTYPTDVGLLYAYFPCFATDASQSATQLKERISLVIRRSLEAVNGSGSQTIDVGKFLDLYWARLADGDLRRRSTIIDALGTAWCEYENVDPTKTTVVLKETSQAVFFEELKGDLPSLRMIHVVRDPRDNYAALKAGVAKYYKELGEDELATLASLINRCRMDMVSARANVERYPDSFLPIRFEDLVHEPKPVISKLCDFLNWEFSESMLAPTTLGRPTRGNNHEGKQFTGISSAHAGAWRERISADEAKVIEFWCDREMLDWGYEIAFGKAETQAAFARFYSWYNCRYFYSDSFSRI